MCAKAVNTGINALKTGYYLHIIHFFDFNSNNNIGIDISNIGDIYWGHVLGDVGKSCM